MLQTEMLTSLLGTCLRIDLFESRKESMHARVHMHTHTRYVHKIINVLTGKTIHLLTVSHSPEWREVNESELLLNNNYSHE